MPQLSSNKSPDTSFMGFVDADIIQYLKRKRTQQEFSGLAATNRELKDNDDARNLLRQYFLEDYETLPTEVKTSDSISNVDKTNLCKNNSYLRVY